ncbi:RNA polymerase sigma factor SigM [Haloechinothrix sp. LS1_15]|uniref:RNA polymerase sigma factor SigM n=1 Tax=Haloechinothrix sp. LS1_15 TaxID=2652248 RepID=UPI002947BBB7|nr:RNA polymerase sigma factor SigM [Haloechinothrix sp. LS1_15]MDV6010989.1 RNA polymerase sigma factor SigM [Haloechinothrix sp. LS1_15]
MTAAATDAELIAAHAAGDPNAFTELVRRHRDRMWAVALRTLRNREDAADALQDAFVSAYRAAANFRSESQVSTWLHRIVVNSCLDRIRKQQARPTVSLPDTDEYREPAAPGDAMAQRETRMLVTDALQTLPEEQRVPIVLVDVEGYPVAEAAAILGVAEGTVKSRCARGRTKLAQLLGHLRNPDANANVPPPETTSEPEQRPDASGRVHPMTPRRTEER